MKKLNLKKFSSLAIIGALSCSLLTACGSEDKATTTSGDSAASNKEYNNSYCKDGVPSATLTRLRNGDTFKVGSSGDIFAYIDQTTGEFTGIDGEIAKEAAKRLGIENVEMELIPFSELIINLNSANIDMIADGMYIREDRAELIHYGDIWYTQGGGLLVPEGSKYQSVADFDPDKTVIGYTPGTVWQTQVEKWAEEGVIKEALATGDQTESIVSIQFGKIDGFLTDSTVVEDLFANSPDTVDGLMLASNYEDEPEAIGRIAPSVSFDNIDFMNEFNAVLIEMRDDGTLSKLFEDVKLNPDLHMITNDERTHTMNINK